MYFKKSREEVMSNKPKILLFDIEVTPNVVYTWTCGYNLTIGPDSIVQEREIICISYKWLDEKKVHTLKFDMMKKSDRDKRLLKKFKEIYAQADSVVAHNGKNFDIKWVNTRLLFYRLGPLPAVHVCDTLTEARRAFKFNSNKLDYIAKFIGSQGKDHVGYDCWKAIMNKNKAALNKMVKYCERDILEMEQVYKELQPYIKTLSSHAVTGDREACPSCSNKRVQRYGYYFTATGKHQKYKCTGCGHIYRDSRKAKD